MILVAIEMTEKSQTFLQCGVPKVLESNILAETKVQPTEYY